ncbi:hypothetical protein CDAR_571301 [Caerostris darwini]|uniref:Secreted protein n=1 Tax=Caerostris darwini TaxID=1538125 RepID=A0AAV4SKV4_9ARAC|nr:hypothetical protein CDAR_571301 [Caerostris darwini]
MNDVQFILFLSTALAAWQDSREGGDLRTKISKKPHPTWHGRMRLSLLPCRQSTIYWKTEIYQVGHHLVGGAPCVTLEWFRQLRNEKALKNRLPRIGRY